MGRTPTLIWFSLITFCLHRQAIAGEEIVGVDAPVYLVIGRFYANRERKLLWSLYRCVQEPGRILAYEWTVLRYY